ncbi:MULTISPECIES: hypothetical protein [unclassified Microcoleus]|nr:MULTISPECIES: hypothetical protein [unclassified Microcoleus]
MFQSLPPAGNLGRSRLRQQRYYTGFSWHSIHPHYTCTQVSVG